LCHRWEICKPTTSISRLKLKKWVSIVLRRARIMVLRSSLSNRGKIWMGHSLFSCESFLENVSSSSFPLDSNDTYLVVVSE
jgi:hypothetical protein